MVARYADILRGATLESIRDAVERASIHFAEHPEAALATDAAAVAVHEEGLHFRAGGRFGDVTTDMAKGIGGGAAAPTPGWLLRAALATCDATVWRWRPHARASSSLR